MIYRNGLFSLLNISSRDLKKLNLTIFFCHDYFFMQGIKQSTEHFGRIFGKIFCILKKLYLKN